MEMDDWKSPGPYYIGVKLNHQKNNVSTCVFFFNNIFYLQNNVFLIHIWPVCNILHKNTNNISKQNKVKEIMIQ